MKAKTRITIILVVITLCVLASLGFARFSFGAILPFMRVGLDINYQQTGFIASGIFLGYLISSFISGYFVVKFQAKRVVIFSLILVALSMIFISFTNHYALAIVGSVLMGLGSGGANIPALGLIPRWFAPSRRGMAMGIANSGSGFGILFSGLIVPILISLHPEEGWRYSWWILALFISFIIVAIIIFLKNDPSEVGLKQVGYVPTDTKKSKPKENKEVNTSSVYKNKSVWLIGLCYMGWGFSYLIYSTFLVDYLMTDVGFKKELAGLYFSIGGLVSIFSGFIWGAISDRFGRLATLAAVYLYQAVILIVITVTTNNILLLFGVICYGLSLWAVPTITTVGVSEVVNSKVVPIAMGFVTLFFGVGQFISPIITGALIDAANNYTSALFLSASIVFIACLLSFVSHMNYKRSKLAVNHSEI